MVFIGLFNWIYIQIADDVDCIFCVFAGEILGVGIGIEVFGQLKCNILNLMFGI